MDLTPKVCPVHRFKIKKMPMTFVQSSPEILQESLTSVSLT
ncbi:hypothetical protein HMPREF0281_02605 [Corynebacterium ammoniagenes DSM 20306]|uniref:Uncharacterized protein n=1 Tax=Corynebacterium ammoniagenes DSM 20306 TaxID=649754 RepID=A0ABN0ACL8_CORAM|nr:hypothetical protein HMPREF0281_02605 [Corynebacterium ammoniagenes DSM 20306]